MRDSNPVRINQMKKKKEDEKEPKRKHCGGVWAEDRKMNEKRREEQ